MIISDSNGNSRTFINNARDYGDYFDWPGTMVESYDYNMQDFPMDWTARFYNYWVYTTSGVSKPGYLYLYTYGVIHEAVRSDETQVVRGFPVR